MTAALLWIAFIVSLVTTAWFRHQAGQQRTQIRNAVKAKGLELPEVQPSGYGPDYLNAFIAAAGQAHLRNYARPVLMPNDIRVAIAGAVSLMLLAVALAVSPPWNTPRAVMAGLAIAGALAYAIADWQEDCALVQIFETPGPVTASAASAASIWTQVKLFSLFASAGLSLVAFAIWKLL